MILPLWLADALAIKFSSYSCHNTVSYYDTTLTSLLINYYATSDFCLHGMHDTSYDTPIVASLSRLLLSCYKNELVIRPRRNGWLDIQLEFKKDNILNIDFSESSIFIRLLMSFENILPQDILYKRHSDWRLKIVHSPSHPELQPPNELVHDQKEQRTAMNREPNGDWYCTSIQLRISTGSIYKDTHWQSI
jgi:hypothetical protein